MHTEWHTLDLSELDYDERYRFVIEYTPDGESAVTYEQERSVPDIDDEPLVDGLYVDKDDERWLRLNGLWSYYADELNDFADWESNASTYAPFELVPVEEY